MNLHGRSESRSFPALVLFALAVRAGDLSATNVSGTISTNTTWTTAASPYVVTGPVTVAAGVTLTVQPGVTVNFNWHTSLDVNGTLIANGSSGTNILFTSNETTHSRGYWDAIYLESGSVGSQISYATVSYGGVSGADLHIRGGTPSLANVTVTQSSTTGIQITGAANPTLQSCQISSNAQYGVTLSSGGAATITDTAFTSNTWNAILVDPSTALAGLTGITASGNGANTISVRSGNVTVDTTWRSAPIPIELTGSVTVNAGKTLTIQAGATVKFDANLNLDVLGTLMAVGTSSQGITFTSNQTTQTKGFWGTIILESGASASHLSYVTVSYGGNNGAQNCELAVRGSSPSMDHLTVSQSSKDGLQVSVSPAAPAVSSSLASSNVYSGFVVLAGATLSLTSVTADSNGDGLYVGAGSSMSLNGASLTNNTGWAIGAEHDTSLTGLTTVTMSGNGGGAHNVIDYRGGTIAGNEHWTAGVERWLDVTTTVASTGVLTIDPGVTVRGASGCMLDVNGKLFAQGTSVSGILLTGQTASPGSWAGLRFESGANPSASVVSYLTLSYAGVANTGALRISGSSPSFDHLTVSNSPYDGVLVVGGASPTIQNSAFNSNAQYGIDVAAGSGSSLTLNNSSFASNGWYAMLIDPTTALTGLSNLTATSNGGNTIAIRSGTMSANSTWHATTIPYSVTGSVTIGSGANLTIDAGTTLKFSYHVGTLTVGIGGKLTAVGTVAAPIVFTSEKTTPAAGDWGSIQFNLGSDPGSQLKYATVSYGSVSGSNVGSVRISSASPSVDHVTFLNYGYAAMSYDGTGGAPTITNCAFMGTAIGIQTGYQASVITARFNYWNSASGPSGAGSGTGGYVSGSVVFEPWLTAVPSSPDWISTSGIANRTFNPAIGINQTVSFGSVEAGNWTTTWKDSGGTAVRTITGSGATGAPTWDGKNDSGVAQPNGTYSYQIASTSSGGDVATPIRGVSIINNALAFTLSGVAVSQPFFSPNGDGVQDTTTISATASFDSPTWTVNVLNGGGTTVRTYTAAGQAISYTWDGKDSGFVVQPDGLYTLQILATDGLAQTNASTTSTLDNTPPTVALTAPIPNQVISNVYQNGSADWTAVGSTSDTNLASWEVDYGVGTSPTSWTLFATGTNPVTAAPFGTWHTSTLANGLFSVRLVGYDKAGNKTATTVSPLTVGNFKITPNIWQFNAATGGSVTYTSIVPFPLTETIVIKTMAGAPVLTLLSGLRAANTYTDVWNAATIPDGPYYFFASVTDGTHSMSVDGSTAARPPDFRDGGTIPVTAFDPFNNQPEIFNFGTGDGASGPPNGIAYIIFAIGPYPPTNNCVPPSYCPINHVLMQAGMHQLVWNGIDPSGAFREDIGGVVYEEDVGIPIGAVVVWGRVPTITSVHVTPPRYGPLNGTQNLTFTLATYQNQSVPLTITFVNQGSLSTLRTISIPSQAPGPVSLVWDGRADDGSLVAPGPYTITVSTTDSVGNVGIGQVLTRVEY